MSIYQNIEDFVSLAIRNGSAEEIDRIYLRNKLCHFLGVYDWEEVIETQETDSLVLLDRLGKDLDEFQVEELMDFISPAPSRINKAFWSNYRNNPEDATEYFYEIAKQINQVKTRDIARNIAFNHSSKYGNLEITINLSKPEKDPKKIAAALTTVESNYPACQLCFENEGYYGNSSHPARSNHRIVQLDLNCEKYGFQYSPYAYYNEHAIVMNAAHTPMAINPKALKNILAFLDVFPHYMIGSNADLPIVGGSILTHDHYQAGRHEFPMAKAEIREQVQLEKYPEIQAGIVNWPMSVLRLRALDREVLAQAAEEILADWRAYSDLSLELSAHSADGTLHHTITPIARKREEFYELDLVLRDNNVSEEHPDGIFHPYAELHHIKKENIGLIEVMGLAILPARLKTELKEVEKFLLDDATNQIDAIHLDWAKELQESDTFTKENVEEKVRQAVGRVFAQVLECAGVYKDDEAGRAGFRRFVEFINR